MQEVHTHKSQASTTSHLIAQPKKRFSSLFEKILSIKGGYFSDKLYGIGWTEDQAVQLQEKPINESTNLYWLILGREHYFETSKDYPIANKGDLKKALQFEEASLPFQGDILRHIERINESSHRVTFWVINSQAFSALPFRPWLVLPESYVIAKGLKGSFTLATVERLDKSLFVAETGLGIFSGIQSPKINSIEHFALSTGSPFSHDATSRLYFKAEQFCALLHQGMQSLVLEHLSGFLLTTKKTDWKTYPWQQAAIITTTIFSFYIMLTSGWLIFSDYQVKQQLAEQKNTVERAFSLQKKYKKQKQWQEKLTVPLKGQMPYWNIWPIILESIKVGAKITAINYKNKKITVHGTTKKTTKATDILAMLSEHKNVNTPSFSKPVKRSRGNEQFAISFTLNAEKNQNKLNIDNSTPVAKVVKGEHYAASK